MRASLAAGVSTDLPPAPPLRVNSRGLQDASDIEAQDKHTSACHNTVNWSLAWLVNQIFFFLLRIAYCSPQKENAIPKLASVMKDQCLCFKAGGH